MNYQDTVSLFVSESLHDLERLGVILRGACADHSHLSPDYICSECVTPFCAECIKKVGEIRMGICRACGSLCLPVPEVKKQVLLLQDQGARFGIQDLLIALRYPLQDPLTFSGAALIYGALLFLFFCTAQIGILFGAVYLAPAFLANAFMFGFASRVIDRVEQGNLDARDIFDAIPLVAEIGDTAKMGSAIVLQVFWPLLVVILYGVRSPALILLSVCWVIVYYPAALVMAAITQSFWQTVNPIMALSAILRMGGIYWQLFTMYLMLLLASLVAAGGIVLLILPGTASLVVYLTLGIVAAAPVFYANMAIATLIGRALFKCADRF